MNKKKTLFKLNPENFELYRYIQMNSDDFNFVKKLLNMYDYYYKNPRKSLYANMYSYNKVNNKPNWLRRFSSFNSIIENLFKQYNFVDLIRFLKLHNWSKFFFFGVQDMIDSYDKNTIPHMIYNIINISHLNIDVSDWLDVFMQYAIFFENNNYALSLLNSRYNFDKDYFNRHNLLFSIESVHLRQMLFNSKYCDYLRIIPIIKLENKNKNSYLNILPIELINIIIYFITGINYNFPTNNDKLIISSI